MLPMPLQVPLAGSYNSAIAEDDPDPPATSTMPLDSSVAVEWGLAILPVLLQVPLVGSYSSALVMR